MSEPISERLLYDITDRDAQTEPQTVAHLLPLGRSGSKYDHARRQTSDYHLDSDELAMGDRHALLDEGRRQRAVLAELRAKVEGLQGVECYPEDGFEGRLVHRAAVLTLLDEKVS